MIKLIIEDATIDNLTSEQLKFLDWKSLTKADVDAASTQIISTNCTKLSVNMFRHACKTGKVTSDAMSPEEWIDFIKENIVYTEDQRPFFSSVQLPYSVVNHFLNMTDRYSRNRYVSILMQTQKCIPMDTILADIDSSTLNAILRTGSNPALIDYMFSPEGVEVLKRRKFTNDDLAYITSTEAEKIGLRRKNYTISPKVLSRAGACSDGINYCRRTLKELNVDSIKWDEMIQVLRTNKQICSRAAVHNYISWIMGHNRGVARASEEVEA